MRKFVFATLAMAGALGFVTLGSSQQPGGGRPGFGGGGGGRTDLVSLLNNPAVAKELKLTEEQVKQVPEALAKAIGGVLDPEQLKRLKQIELQQRGSQAFSDPKVQEALGLSDEQKSNVKSLLEDYRKEMGEIFSANKGGNFGDNFKKMASLRTETQEKLNSVLSEQQQKSWKTMLGEKFEMPTFGGGAPGGGGGFPKKRPDAKKGDV